MLRGCLLFCSLIMTLIIPKVTTAQTVSPSNKTPLRVGVAGSPPFVTQTNRTAKGISVEIWQELAAMTNLKYELIAQPGVKAGIDR